MFFPEGQVRVFVYGEPVNMRLSFEACMRSRVIPWARIQ